MHIENISGIHHVLMTVRDGESAAQWYRDVFGFELVHKFTRTWLVGAGRCNIGLQQVPDGQPVDGLQDRIALQHVAFHVPASAIEGAANALRALNIPFEHEPRGPVAGPSLFFHDLDGHLLEVTAYESDEQA